VSIQWINSPIQTLLQVTNTRDSIPEAERSPPGGPHSASNLVTHPQRNILLDFALRKHVTDAEISISSRASSRSFTVFRRIVLQCYPEGGSGRFFRNIVKIYQNKWRRIQEVFFIFTSVPLYPQVTAYTEERSMTNSGDWEVGVGWTFWYTCMLNFQKFLNTVPANNN
jgi:hypothetical protein